jgi:hypothetical protein
MADDNLNSLNPSWPGVRVSILIQLECLDRVHSLMSSYYVTTYQAFFEELLENHDIYQRVIFELS